MKLHRFWGSLVLLAVLVLPACGAGGEGPAPEENVLVYAALNPVTSQTQKAIDQFNEKHPDIPIVIHDYSDDGGLDRLRTELVLGQTPDIMEMHYFGTAPSRVGKNNEPVEGGGYISSWKYVMNSTLDDRPADEYWMPYRQMVQKGYLEDLWPYIEADEQLGRNGVVEAPLKAAEADGGLYILFKDFRINSLMGRESVVGNRYGWTLEELLETFAAMPEDATILQYNATRWDVFSDLICSILDNYVDVSAGTCSFDNDGFRDLLKFLMQFPDEAGFAWEDPEHIANERWDRVRHGEQMLEVTQFCLPDQIALRDAFWGERTAFVGYPTADGSSGNSFYPMGDVLAMSSSCQNKDAAWEYIRELIKPRRRRNRSMLYTTLDLVSIPVNMHDYEVFLWGQTIAEPAEYQRSAEELRVPGREDALAWMQWYRTWQPYKPYGPEVVPMALLTEADGERFTDIINHTTRLYWPDDALADIIWDAAGPYFAGDKPLDLTVELIQNRVQLYVDENR